jgi:hypothetical protein
MALSLAKRTAALTSLFQLDLGYLLPRREREPEGWSLPRRRAPTPRLDGAAAIEKVLSTLANSW